MTTRKSKKTTVSVWVPWGTDQCECKMPLRTWGRILAGREESCSFETAYEDWEGSVYFRFNRDGHGSPYATYGEDGGEMYIGDLDGAAILIDGEEIPWSELKRPEGPPSAPKKLVPSVSSQRSGASIKKSSERAKSGKGNPSRTKSNI